MKRYHTLALSIAIATSCGTAQANTFYCVNDGGLNDSQFCDGMPPFTALGPVYVDCDIEALDLSLVTNDMYAAAGDDTHRKSHLYYVYKDSGDMVDLGNIGGPGHLEEIDALSFHPVTDELWGWSQGDGLFVIPTLPSFPQPAIQPVVDIENPRCRKPVEDVTIPAKVVAPFANEVEDITWSWSGEVLYAVENLHQGDPDISSGLDYEDGIKLWAYDEVNGARELCPNLAPAIAEALGHEAEIEGLEALPNDFMSIPGTEDLLVATFHGAKEMYYATITARPTLSTRCDIWVDRVDVSFNDIEGIAFLPSEECSAMEVEGNWSLFMDYNCDGRNDSPPQVLTFSDDATWSVKGFPNHGTWAIQDDCSVGMNDNFVSPPVIWTGTDDDGNLSGTYNGGGISGCWTAIPTPLNSFEESIMSNDAPLDDVSASALYGVRVVED